MSYFSEVWGLDRVFPSVQMSVASTGGILVNQLVTLYKHMKKGSKSCSFEYSSSYMLTKFKGVLHDVALLLVSHVIYNFV